MLLLFVVFIIVLTIYEEKKTENALFALRRLSSPRALVIRDSLAFRVAGREVVPGDYVVLYEGDRFFIYFKIVKIFRVPADVVIIQCFNLQVDESLLTGESVSVRKEEFNGTAEEAGKLEVLPPGRKSKPSDEIAISNVFTSVEIPVLDYFAYSGTLVVGGHCVAIARTTGGNTEMGKIGQALSEVKEEKTPLEKEMRMLIVGMFIVGVLASIAVLLLYGFTRGGTDGNRVWINAVLVAISLAMSLLPEEFPVVLTVFMALGAWRISKEKVLASKNKAIETLGAASILCTGMTEFIHIFFF
jgi:Ca2+-transporting ATPase